MKHLKSSFALLMLLALITSSQTFAQDSFISVDSVYNGNLNPRSKEEVRQDRAKEVMQDNEYTSTGYEQGEFLSNPLMLNGKPLDYGAFNLESKGELTVIKEAAKTGQTTQVPFNMYLRRNGNKVLIPGMERSDPTQIKIDISVILRNAKPGDQLVIEPVKKEDGFAKRILKLLGSNGC